MKLWKHLRRRHHGRAIPRPPHNARSFAVSGAESVVHGKHLGQLRKCGMLDGAEITPLDDEGYPGLVHIQWPIPDAG